MAYAEITREGAIAIITLNRPEKLNSFDTDCIASLEKVIAELSESDARVVIITGKGRAFCAGGDIAWEQTLGEMDASETEKVMSGLQKLFCSIEGLKQPVIAAVNGHAVGGGAELAMACDIRIANDSAVFIQPETSLGVVAPLGATQRLPRLVGLGRAKLMLYSGNPIDGKTAHAWGLVDLLVEDVMQSALELAATIAEKPAAAVSATKQLVNKHYLDDLQDADELREYVTSAHSEENKKRLQAFLDRKKS